MRLLVLSALAACVIAASAPTPTVTSQSNYDLVNNPITLIGPKLIDSSIVIVGVVVGESLRVTVNWEHPTDGLGNEDSTFFRIKASQTIRFNGGGSVAPDTYRRRRWNASTTADTFKVIKPPIGGKVTFQADSISQCRKGACSAPGGAGWGYERSFAPPAMTFIKVTVDSF